MQAWRVHDFGDIRLDEVPEPQIKPGYVKLAIKVVQPSVTEIIRFRGGTSRRVDQFRRILAEQGPSPLFGHEFAGVVIEVGSGVTEFQVGDRVASFLSHIACGECVFCQGGLEQHCQSTKHIGQHMPGAFAERAVIPASTLVKLPDTVSFSAGACVQPMMWCLSAVHAAQIVPGDTVVILGQGAIGLGITQLARHSGASCVITTCRRDLTAALSKTAGANLVVQSDLAEAVEAIRAATGGLGAHVVFDTAGGSSDFGLSGGATLAQALDVAIPGGTVVDGSSHAEPVTMDLQVLQRKSLRLCYPVHPPHRKLDWMISLMADGRVDVEPTILHRLEGLDQVPKAFEITANKPKYGAINPAQVILA